MSTALQPAVNANLAPRSVPVGVEISMTFTPVLAPRVVERFPDFPPQYTAARVESFFDLWPQCVNAKQPPEPADAGVLFPKPWAHDAKHFRLRARADSSAGLVGPFQGVGGCCDPFFRNGDISWIDPSIEPQHLDFVCVMWSEDFYQRLMRATGDDFIRETGRAPSGLAVKRLLRVGGLWMLATVGSRGKTATVQLANNARVLGVVTYIERSGSSTIDALPAHCIRLEKCSDSGLLVVGAATDISAVEVNSDSYSFPNPTGTQDRVFTAFDLVNPAVESYDLEVSVTGGRQVTTPAGLSGTTDVLSWISISNLTDSVLVSSTQDYMSAQLEDVPANTTRSFIESTVFIVTIPGKKTFRFTPRCRVAPLVGSTGNIQLLTTAYTMRIATVKR